MQTRKYLANSMAEGLIKIREDLGKDAMILSVEENPHPMNASKTCVEIVAQGEPQTNAATLQAEVTAKAQPAPKAQSAPQKMVASLKEKVIDRSSDEDSLLASLYAQKQSKNNDFLENVVDEFKKPAQSTKSLFTERQITPKKKQIKTQAFDPFDFKPEPIREAPKFLNNSKLPPEASALYFYLLDTGIDRDIADEMIERLSIHFQRRKDWRKDKIRAFLGNLVAKQFQVGGAFTNGKKRRVAALIGPTGVGKTTTVAKIATKLAQNHVSVGLITLDQFRVAAVDQLRKFAGALNIPLLAASTKKEFMTALRGLRSRQVVLIDTSGQNPRDIDLLERLNHTLMTPEPIERHLVLAAPTKERDLTAFVELYRMIGFDNIIFSKLDETVTYGGILNTYFAANVPFSYFTTGQKVPEDMEEADADRLNELLFN